MRAKSAKWPIRQVPGKGGKGGIKTLYQPPAPVLAAIAALRQSPPGGSDDVPARRSPPDPDSPQPGGAYAMAGDWGSPPEDPTPGQTQSQSGSRAAEAALFVWADRASRNSAPELDPGEIHPGMLEHCALACLVVFQEPYRDADLGEQLRVAAEFYNLLVRIARQANHRPLDVDRLEVGGLVEQLRLLVKFGWFPPYPRPPSNS